MAWWWSSKPAPNTDTSSSNLSSSAQVEAVVLPDPSAQTVEPVKNTLSREEQSNQELLDLIKEFQAQADAEQGQRIQTRTPGNVAPSVPVPSDISPNSLYPTELSCRSAFDYAMFCQSFGGQFVNIYRYGTFRSCSNHWDDFFMCMRTRNWVENERTQAVQDHYRKKAIKWKTGPSSEDVWEVREEPVRDAFQSNLEELEAQITNWQKANPGAPDPWKQDKQPTFTTSSIAM